MNEWSEAAMVNSYLTPWAPVTSNRSNLEDELCKEIAFGHPLYSLEVRAIARRTDNDDVLFKVDAPDFQYACVHLTWSGEAERDLRWPDTELFTALEDWVQKRMIPDHERAGSPRWL